jgi:glycosidase
MIEFYKNIINMRLKNKVLIDGDTKFINTENDDIFGFVRFNENEKIVILLNRSCECREVSLKIDGDLLEEITPKNTQKVYVENIVKENEKFTLEVEPKSCAVFEVKCNLATSHI